MSLPKLDKIVLLPIACITIQIIPNAISSLDVLLLALPKREAVALLGSPGSG